MSIKVMTYYWDNSEQDGHKLLALLALSDWSNDEGECFPRIQRLEQRLRRKRRAVQQVIKELEKEGEVLVYPGMGKGPEGRRSSLYYLIRYRESIGLEIPPMIIEAAQHYREKERKQGKMGLEIRKSQAALLDRTPTGAADDTPTGAADDTPTGAADRTPTGAADRTPTGAADRTPTGAADRTQIRHIDPSCVDPSFIEPSLEEPLATESLDDDDAFVFPVKDVGVVGNSQCRDRDAMRIEGLRHHVDQCLQLAAGAAWDDRENWIKKRSFDELRATLLWCVVHAARLGKNPNSIIEPVGFIRDGVENHKIPGLRPQQIQAVDEDIALIMEIAETGVKAA